MDFAGGIVCHDQLVVTARGDAAVLVRNPGNLEGMHQLQLRRQYSNPVAEPYRIHSEFYGLHCVELAVLGSELTENAPAIELHLASVLALE